MRTDRPARARERIVIAALLCAITAGAFALRVLNRPQVFVGDTVRFVESDAFYHMRRVFLALERRGAIPPFDSYMNFPAGFHCNWPPLSDLLIAGTAFLAGGGNPSTRVVEMTGALAPPVLGALTPLCVFFIARFYLGRRFALLAAAWFAILPFHIQVSVLGRPDHHVLVVLLSSLLYLSLLVSAGRHRTAEILARAAVSGFLLFLCFCTWLGSLLFAVILFLSFAGSLLVHRADQSSPSRVALAGGCLFGVAGVLLWPVAARTVWGRAGEWRWDALSFFHVAVLFAAATAILGIGWLLPRIRRPGRRLFPFLFAGLAGAAALLFLVARAPGRAMGLQWSEWFLKKDPLMRHLVESMPLSLGSAQQNFSRFAILFPALIPAVSFLAWRRSRPERGLLFLVWCLILGLGTLLQERFSDLFSVPAAILNAAAAALAMRAARFPFRAGKSHPHATGFRRRVMMAVVTAALTIWALFPTAQWLTRYARSAPRLSRETLHHLCLWLHGRTPHTAGYALRGGSPAYAVLAEWPLGNALVYIARRPNVANNFVGWRENRESNLLPYRFFVEDDPARAAALLRSCGVRYVIAGEPIESGFLARAADILGIEHAVLFSARQQGGRPVYAPTPAAIRSMAVRLYLDDAQSLDPFRLVYESPARQSVAGVPTPVYKVFEFTGGSPPGPDGGRRSTGPALGVANARSLL